MSFQTFPQNSQLRRQRDALQQSIPQPGSGNWVATGKARTPTVERRVCQITKSDDDKARNIQHYYRKKLTIVILFWPVLQRHLLTSSNKFFNAALHVASNTCKLDGGLAWLLHDEFHWLDVSGIELTVRVTFKLVVTVHCCLNGHAHEYVVNCGVRLDTKTSCQNDHFCVRWVDKLLVGWDETVLSAQLGHIRVWFKAWYGLESKQ